MNNIIEFQNVSKSFGDLKVLNNLNIQVKYGEKLALIGPSGSGKTSLIRCITGLENPDEGEVVISDSVVFSDDINIPIEKRDVGIVFLDFALNSTGI